MAVKVSTSGNVTRVSLAGDLDFSAQDALKRAIEQAVNTSAAEVEVDMEETIFIDSAIIRLLLKLRETAARNGKSMFIVNCSENIHEIFTIGGFDQIFDIR